MTIILIYTAITAVLTGIAMVIGFAIEQTALAWISMPVFISLFFISLWLGWVIAVRLTEPKNETAPASGVTSQRA